MKWASNVCEASGNAEPPDANTEARLARQSAPYVPGLTDDRSIPPNRWAASPPPERAVFAQMSNSLVAQTSRSRLRQLHFRRGRVVPHLINVGGCRCPKRPTSLSKLPQLPTITFQPGHNLQNVTPYQWRRQNRPRLGSHPERTSPPKQEPEQLEAPV
jgi:hypothetical protein